MKRLTVILCVPMLLLGASRAADTAMTLTFDDLTAGAAGSWIAPPNGYAGLLWNNFGVLDGSVTPMDSGYRIGMISPQNVAFNLSGGRASINRPSGFSLHSAYLTRALDLRAGVHHMHVRVRGSVGTNVTYDNTYVISNTAPLLIEFNYIGVEQVTFVSSPDSPFVMDDLTVTVPRPDESCTYVVSPRRAVHGSGAEVGTVSVATEADCSWSVFNTNAWITILSGANNSGSGTISYAVAAGPRVGERRGVVSIAGQNFEIVQSSEPAVESELTFDDLLPGAGVPNGYGELQWVNFGVLDGSILPTNSGYRRGVVSPHNVAFNGYGDPALIRSSSPFDLESGFMTAAINIPNYIIHVRVQALAGGRLRYDKTYTLSNTAPAFIEFGLRRVNEVRFIPSQHSTWFVVDQMRVSVSHDRDGDGIADSQDQCSGTASGAIVSRHGCSIEQLAPCAGPPGGGRWRNHGEYVAAVARAAESFRREGLITLRQKNAIVQEAARSDCGKSWRDRHGDRVFRPRRW